MFISRHPPDRLDEGVPGLPLLDKDALALRRQPVEAAATLIGLLDPRPLDPAALLEAVEQRVERIDVKLQLSARARLDQLAQVVAMPRAGIEQREDEQFSRAAFQLAIERARVDI